MKSQLWEAFRTQPTEAAFRPLYERTKALVYTLCRRILRNEEDARDAFQGVYCRLVELARGGVEKGLPADVENLVYRLSVREADRLRKRRTRRARKEVCMDSSVPDPGSRPERVVDGRQLREMVESLVASLPARYRLPLELHYFHGCSYAEIGKILGRPLGTVSVYISRALKKLDPLMRRAGLGKALAVLGGFFAGAELVSPPAALGAAAVFARAKASAGAAGTTVAGSAASILGTTAIGVGIMKTKVAIVSTVIALAALGLISFAVVESGVFEKDEAEVARVTQALPATPPAEGTEVVEAPPDVRPVAGPEEETQVATPAGPVLLGVVIDEGSGEAIEGATVSCWADIGHRRQATTDASGRFRFDSLKAGRHEVEAWTETHVRVTLVVNVPESGESTSTVRLERGYEVEVLVLDHEGGPIDGAHVYGQPTIISKYSDDNGRARVGGVRREGHHDIYAAKDGYGFAGAFQPVFEPDAEVGSVTIVLKSKAVIAVAFAGRVVDAEDRPVSGAKVVWGEGSHLPGGTDSTTTDEDGLYRLEAHSAAEYNQLSVLADGFAPSWQATPPRGSVEEPARVDFRLVEGHWIEGVVVGPDDRPLEGAEVVVYTRNESGAVFECPMQSRPKTDAVGTFRFGHLPGPRVRLQIRGPGATWRNYNGWSLFEEWFGVDRAVRIVLEREGVIPLRVVAAEDGEPIPRFLVRHDGAYHDDWAVGESVESEAGTFVVANLKQGKAYELKVESDGWIPERRQGIVARERTEAEEVIFELSKGRALEGFVFDVETGARIAGAEILYGVSKDSRVDIYWGEWDRGGSSRLDNLQRVESARDGSFTIAEGERPGHILVRAPGYERRVVAPGAREKFLQGGEIRIGLGRGGSVVGAYSRGGRPQVGVQVWLRKADGKSELFPAAKTDETGRYRWDGLKAGTYKIYATVATGPPGLRGATLERTFELARGEAKVVDLGGDMGPFSVSGQVTEDGKPLFQAKVELEALFEWDYGTLAAFTDSAGRYRIDGLAAGEYRALVVKWLPSSRFLKRDLEVRGSTTRDFAFAEIHRVTGSLRFPRGAPEALFQWMAFRAPEGTVAGQNEEEVASGARGDLDGGHFEIESRLRGVYKGAIGYALDGTQVSIGLSPSFRLDNLERDHDLGVIDVPPVGSLRVRFKYAADSMPRPDSMTLSLRERGEERWLNSIYLRSKKPEQLIEAVKAGTFLFVPLADGFLSEPEVEELTILPGRTTTVEVTLRPTGLIQGAVADPIDSARQVKILRVTLEGKGERRLVTPSPRRADGFDVVGVSRDQLHERWFRLSGLDRGTYRVTIEAEGYEPHTYTVDVTPGLRGPPESILLKRAKGE